MQAELAAALAQKAASTGDAAAVELALTYARLMDEAAPTASYAKAMELISPWVPGDKESTEAWRRITTALSEHSVASDLGPKLLAVLEALGMSPRARAALNGGKPDDKRSKSPLDELRERRARKDGTSSLDTTAS